MDENMPPAVADQLRATDIDVSSVHELEIFSEDDPILLELANEVERVICTRDADFVRLAQAGMEHAGIVFFDRGQRNIGYMVRSLRSIAQDITMEEMRNRVEFR